jgi:hypothetical protein
MVRWLHGTLHGVESIQVRPNNVRYWLYSILILLCFVLPLLSIRDAVASTFAIVFFVAIVAMLVRATRRRITIDDEGITRRWMRTARISWDQVACYTYWTKISFGDAAGTNKDIERQFVAIKIVDVGGSKIAIDHGWRRPYAAVARAIEALHPRLQATGFEPFSFTDGALRHIKRGDIAFADIDKVIVSADWLSIRTPGKTIEWAGVELKRLVSSLLFLERLAERGVNVIISGGQFIPPLVRQRLSDAKARTPAATRGGG